MNTAIYVNKLHRRAVIPTRQTELSSGMDLHALTLFLLETWTSLTRMLLPFTNWNRAKGCWLEQGCLCKCRREWRRR